MTIAQVLAWRNKPETQKLLQEMDTFAHQRARDILTQALPRAASALSNATLTTSRPTGAEALAEDTRRKAATKIIALVTGQTPKPVPPVPPRSPTPDSSCHTNNTTSNTNSGTPTTATSVLPTSPTAQPHSPRRPQRS